MDNCIFCRIVKGEIPCSKVHEDEEFLVFKDIAPKAPVHLLIIPKQHIVSLAQTTQSDAALLGRMLALVPVVAKQAGCEDGFRTIINTGRVGGQEVYHLHIHVLGGSEPLPTMI